MHKGSRNELDIISSIIQERVINCLQDIGELTIDTHKDQHMDEVDALIDSVVAESQQRPGISSLVRPMHYNVDREDTIPHNTVSYNAEVLNYIIQSQQQVLEETNQQDEPDNFPIEHILSAKAFSKLLRRNIDLQIPGSCYGLMRVEDTHTLAVAAEVQENHINDAQWSEQEWENSTVEEHSQAQELASKVRVYEITTWYTASQISRC